MTAGEFARKVNGAKKVNSQWSGLCSAHDDQHESLSWADGNKGVVLMCHAGCSVEAVVAALGLRMADLFVEPAPSRAPKKKGKIVATYDYRDEQAALLYQVVRRAPKHFYQRRPDGRDGWVNNIKGVRKVVYKLPEIIAAMRGRPAGERVVVIPEGEKDVETLWALGIPATTNPMGAGKWSDEHTAQLKAAGVEMAIAIPDNDVPGRKHADVVAASCAKAMVAKLAVLPGLAPPHEKHGEDVSDWLAMGHGAEELRRVLDAAAVVQPQATEPGKKVNHEDSEDDCEKPAVGHAPRVTQAQRLNAIADAAELFHGPDGDTAFATLSVNGHRETWPVKSRGFRQWLTHSFYQSEGKPPSAQALTEAVASIEARARFDGDAKTVHLRVAGHGDAIFLDLGNAAHEAVRITAGGWDIVTEPPVKFRRTRGMLALPTPERGGSLGALWRFVNIKDEDRPLFAGALVMALNPKGPYPAIVLHGSHGCAKSTAARVFKRLVDPNASDLRSEPREGRDLAIASWNGWCVALDNLSAIPGWLSDALCRLSTGAGFATRELYTDLDETIIEAQRPVIVNGIEEIVTRPDLLSRSIILYLPEIDDDRRRDEKAFWADFEAAQAATLGALLDAVSAALRNISTVRLARLPRMADFALWAVAAEPALGFRPGAFMAAYDSNVASGHELALEASPIASPVLALTDRGWEGTAKELLAALETRADDAARKNREWPKSPKGVANALRRIVSNLQAKGVMVEFQDKPELDARRRQITIQRVKEERHRSDGSDGSDGLADRLADRSQNGTLNAGSLRQNAPSGQNASFPYSSVPGVVTGDADARAADGQAEAEAAELKPDGAPTTTALDDDEVVV